MIRLTLPLPPNGNHYKGVTKTGRTYVTHEAVAYRKAVAGHALAAGVREPIAALVCLQIQIWRARKAGDLDGFLKVLLDAMQGSVYVNDSQIRALSVFMGDDKANPRVEVEAEEIVIPEPTIHG